MDAHDGRSMVETACPTTQAAQLRVLCRKFAYLSEKVKDETNARQKAEKEATRLKKLMEDNANPVITSCKGQVQAYVRELKNNIALLTETLEKEKAKNASLEIQLQERGHSLHKKSQESSTNTSTKSPCEGDTVGSAWDRKHILKMQATFSDTINELQSDVEKKEREISHLTECLQKEKWEKQKIHDELAIEASKRQQAEMNTKKVKEACETMSEDAKRVQGLQQCSQSTIDGLEQEKIALTEQVTTLNQLNDALETRCAVLVRRNDINKNILEELKQTKVNLTHAELENQKLHTSIKSIKAEYTSNLQEREVEIGRCKTQLAQLKEKWGRLHDDYTALQSKNNLMVEWSAYRSTNQMTAPANVQAHNDDNSSKNQTTPPQNMQAAKTALRGGLKKHEIEDFLSIFGDVNTETHQQEIAQSVKKLLHPIDDSDSPPSPTTNTIEKDPPTSKSTINSLRKQNELLRRRLVDETEATKILEQDIMQITSTYNTLLGVGPK